jgi:hypothetical protein
MQASDRLGTLLWGPGAGSVDLAMDLPSLLRVGVRKPDSLDVHQVAEPRAVGMLSQMPGTEGEDLNSME